MFRQGAGEQKTFSFAGRQANRVAKEQCFRFSFPGHGLTRLRISKLKKRDRTRRKYHKIITHSELPLLELLSGSVAGKIKLRVHMYL